MTAATIPFRQEENAEYGVPQKFSSLVRRVVCNNPSSFTYHGTNTYIVGTGTVAVIDPGPDDERHIEAVAAAVKGEEVSHIIVTHTHIDHSPGTRALQELVGAPIVGLKASPIEDGKQTVEAGMKSFEHKLPDTTSETELLALVDHLIVPERFARQATGVNDPARATEALWSDDRAAVVVTCGPAGCWYLGEPSQEGPRHYPAPAIDVVDTTGCGDVFHGAYAAGIAWDWDVSRLSLIHI